MTIHDFILQHHPSTHHKQSGSVALNMPTRDIHQDCLVNFPWFQCQWTTILWRLYHHCHWKMSSPTPSPQTFHLVLSIFYQYLIIYTYFPSRVQFLLLDQWIFQQSGIWITDLCVPWSKAIVCWPKRRECGWRKWLVIEQCVSLCWGGPATLCHRPEGGPACATSLCVSNPHRNCHCCSQL